MSHLRLRPVGRRPAWTAAGLLAWAIAWVGAISPATFGQVVGNAVVTSPPPGVYLDADGTIRRRQPDARDELAAMRVRAKAATVVAKDEKLGYVSLPAALAQARAARDAGKPVPDELLYLGGLTQIRYVFVYPDDKDLVIAGPAEGWVVTDDLHAYGRRSGRPILRLDDFVAAVRTVRSAGGSAFGCALDLDPNSLTNASAAMNRLAGASRAERMRGMAAAVGPQTVRVFGTAPDTRFAFTCVAADYELKRYGLGLGQSPVAGVGNGVDSSRSAANKWWFELNYEPLLVSADGTAYGLRGTRLAVKAGGFDFDPRGATATATAFAKRMTQHLDALSAAQPLFAELQNLADLSVVATLIRRDKLDQKAGWDAAWLYDDAAYPVAKVPVPRTAETLVNYANGSIAAGGVMLHPGQLMADAAREKDDKGTLTPAREQASRLRQSAAAGQAVVRAQ